MFFLKVMDVDRIVNPTIINNLPQFKMEVEFIDDWSVDSQDISQLWISQGPPGVWHHGLSRGHSEAEAGEDVNLLQVVISGYKWLKISTVLQASLMPLSYSIALYHILY